MRISDWSSDVCSSDLRGVAAGHRGLVVSRGVAAQREGVAGDGVVAAAGHEGVVARQRQRQAAAHRLGGGLVVRCGVAADVMAAEGVAGDQVAVAAEARSEEHTSEPQSLMRFSYAVFCLIQNTQTYKV